LAQRAEQQERSAGVSEYVLMSRDSAVIIFARAPIPGQTKTRLIAALGASGAADLYRCFLFDILGQAEKIAAAVSVAAAEPEQRDALEAIVTQVCPRAAVTVQSGRDLGERMSAAFDEAFRRGHPSALILGTDLPSLPFERIDRALSLLRDRQLVLGPCLDGGYYLIGLRSPAPQLFQHIDWGSSSVLVDTLMRAQSLSLSVSLLDPWFDVDIPQDLVVLRSYLHALSLAGELLPCPRTWRYLQEHLPETQ
jgi:hypothetical protein